jgi:hypothetical protein
MRAITGDRLVPALLALGIAVVSAGAGAGAYALTAPEPKPVIRTRVLDVPPACQEIAPALQTERARAATLADSMDSADALAAGLDDVALTKDADQIVEHADALDDANRKEQELRLQLATDMATTDAVVADCAPERAK